MRWKALGITCTGCLLFLMAPAARAVDYSTDAGVIMPGNGDTVSNPVGFISTHMFTISGAAPGQTINAVGRLSKLLRDGDTSVRSGLNFDTSVTCDQNGRWSEMSGLDNSVQLDLGAHNTHAESSLSAEGALQSGMSSVMHQFTVQ